MSCRSLAPLLLALSLGGCATVAPPAAERAAQPFRAADHPGIWMSDGYGYVIDARRKDVSYVQLYHAAGDTCVEEIVERGNTVLEFYDRFRIADGGQTLLLSSTLDPYVVRFRRVASLPVACTLRAGYSPRGSLEAFSDYFAKHYAFFGLYGVDWPARSAAAREGVTAQTTDREVFERMREAVRPLRDAHVKIVAQVDGKRVVHDGDRGATEEAVARWGQGQGLDARAANARFRRAYWLDDIQRDILGGQGRIAGNNRIQYGFAAPGIGYLAFASMGGFIDAELASIRRELPVLDAAMDEAIAHFESGGARAVIVDVSFNTGGYDFVALAIAGRFAARQTLAYNRRAGDDPAAVDFPVAVVPANGARFTGPVHLLTADPTASAAEVLVLAMRSLDNVTHVGERTRGAFSTALMKYLPNGWELSLSNEIYTDPRGIVWEGRGIAPQVPLTVFYPDNPLQGHVEAVRALARSIKP